MDAAFAGNKWGGSGVIPRFQIPRFQDVGPCRKGRAKVFKSQKQARHCPIQSKVSAFCGIRFPIGPVSAFSGAQPDRAASPENSRR